MKSLVMCIIQGTVAQLDLISRMLGFKHISVVIATVTEFDA